MNDNIENNEMNNMNNTNNPYGDSGFGNPENPQPAPQITQQYQPPYQGPQPFPYTRQYQAPDQFDELKTSSFYNESYKKPGKGRLKGIIAPLIIVSLISSLLSGGVVAAFFSLSNTRYGKATGITGTSNNPVVTETGTIRQVEIVNETESPVVAIAQKVGPSVVGIQVSYTYDDMFFGTQTGGGSGSGIIYSSDGYIITNNHVIEAAVEAKSNTLIKGAAIEVILPDQEEKPYKAKVIGRDSKTDIAVLKIDAVNLPAVEFGDSDQLKVGELAVAIGNPAGLEFMGSVTGGYISGLNRKIVFEDGKSMKLIQTDAAINPGNSGGALVNSKGQVIGINSSKIGGSGYEGLGFAIPSNIAKETADSLINDGYVKGRPQLGVGIDPSFNNTIADENGVPHGVLVREVTPLSAAYRAGIKVGDILTKFNGTPIESYEELEEEKHKFKAGDVVEIELYRMPEKGDPKDGEVMTITVTLGEDKGN
jgi:serine protease Do